MNQKKQVSKAQTLARGGGERLGEQPRTAATDAGTTKELRQLRQMIKAIIKRIDTRHNDNDQALVIADDLELALKVSEQMR